MVDEPDLQALRALMLTVQLGSISSAATHLGVSQQAVSLRIRKLEKDLHVRLLMRSPRGSRLTPTGELLLGWATPLLTAADDFIASADSLRNKQAAKLRIAASLTIAEHLVPEWITRWRTHLGDKGPLVQLVAENSTAVAAEVRTGTADLGFIETPKVPSDLRTRILGVDEVYIITAPTHPWAQKRSISIHELARTALVLREPGSGTREALEVALDSVGHALQADPAEVLSTTLGVRSAIMAGVAPGALSALATSDDIRMGRLTRIHVRGLTIERPLTAVWTDSSPARHIRSFLDVAAL